MVRSQCPPYILRAVAFLVPLPSMGDNVLNVGIFWRPTQGFDGFLAAANQRRRVSRTPIALNSLNLFSRHLASRFYHLFHRKPAAIAQIKEIRFATIEQIF